MKMTRAQFDEKLGEVSEKLIEANAEMNRLMHKPPSRKLFRRSLKEALVVEKCTCDLPHCPGWFVKKKKITV